MNKLKRKFIIHGVLGSIIPTAFALLGALMLIGGAGHGIGGFFVIFGGVVLAILWSNSTRRYTRMRHMQERDFSWYCAAYPSYIRNNRIACHKCDCDRISVRGVMQHTYMREHACTQCGETLYYSPEGLASV